MTPRLPPAVLEALLRALVGGKAEGRSIVGDLREEYAGARARAGTLRASLWYGAQVVMIGSRFVVVRLAQGWREGEMPSSLLQDCRYGLRSLRAAPLFTLLCVTTLAIGIGATTATYSVVHGVLLDPLPYPEPDRLVDIGNNTGGAGWYGSSPAQLVDFEEQLEALASVGGYFTGLSTIGDSLRPRRVDVAFLTHATWETLGVEPLRGRVFTAEEDLPGAAPVVVLSEGLWRQEFGADPGIVGATIPTNGSPAEVVGVMPGGFTFPDAATTMWLPMQLDRQTATRGNHFVSVVARLGQDRSLEEARDELAALAARSVETYPENYAGRGYRTRMIPLRDAVVGDVRPPILVAFGAVLLVLLIATVNVVNLVLSRGAARRREVAIRAAMGAGRARVARQLTTESALLGLAGGLLGVLLARLGVTGLLASVPPGSPRIDNVSVSAPVLGFALVLVLSTLVVFGLWPATSTARRDLREPLSDGDRGATGGKGQGVRRVLVTSQVALAAALAVGAGVMIRSLGNLYSEDLGFVGESVVTFRVDVPVARYPDKSDRIAFFGRLTEALGAQPGIRVASASGRLPLANTYQNLSIHIEGKPVQSLGAADDAFIQASTPGYFDVMRIRPSRGRLYSESDAPEGPLVAVVNETMARTLFEGGEALGRRVRMWDEDFPYMEVVGVIPDVKERRIDAEPVPRLYIPFQQTESSTYFTPPGLYVALLVEQGDPLRAIPVARRVLAELDPTVPISRIRTMDDIVATSLAAERFVRSLLEVFGLIAIVLACVGVYGVLSVSVSQRTPEIGLRKALGASSEEVVRSVVGESAALALIGGALGIVVGVLLTGALRGLTYQVSGSDPVTLAAVAGVIGLTAVLAALIPAARAGRVDPLVALRSE